MLVTISLLFFVEDFEDLARITRKRPFTMFNTQYDCSALCITCFDHAYRRGPSENHNQFINLVHKDFLSVSDFRVMCTLSVHTHCLFWWGVGGVHKCDNNFSICDSFVEDMQLFSRGLKFGNIPKNCGIVEIN